MNYLIIPDYFDKHRALALSVNQSAVGACQIMMPLFITFLQSKFGDRGTILIHGGLLFNCIVVAMLFRSKSPLARLSKLNARSKTLRTSPQKHEKAITAEYHRKSKLEKVQEDMILHFKGSWGAVKLLRVLILTSGSCILAAGYVNFITLVPFAMRQQGFTKEDIAWCGSAFGFASAGVRIVITPLVGRKWFRSELAYVAGGLCSSLASLGNYACRRIVIE